MAHSLIRFLNGLSIKGYVIFWVVCVFVSCAAVAGGWLRTERRERQMSLQIQSDARALDAGRHLKSRLLGAAYADLVWRTNGDPKFREEAQQELSRAAEILNTMYAYGPTADDLRAIRELDRQLKAFRLQANRKPAPAADELRPAAANLRNAADTYITLQQDSMARTSAVAKALQKSEVGWWIALMALVALLLGAGSLGLLLRVVRPIGELRRTAARFGKGDYGVRAPVARDDEIGALCRTLNGMADNIVSHEASLVRSRDELEQRVQERTAELRAANKALQTEVLARGRVENALRESHERLRLIMENSPDTVSILDRDLVYRWVLNPSSPHTPEEIIGKPLGYSAASPQEAEHYVRLARGVLETGQAVRFETSEQVADAVCHFEFTYQPWRDAEGRIIGVAVHAHDITQRREAEEALRESEETVRALLNATMDAMILLDASGNVLVMNEVSAKRHGKTTREMVGRHVFDTFSPALAQARKAHVDEVFRLGQSVRFEDECDGRWFDNVVYPIRDPQGKVTRVAVCSPDITARKRAEQALRESEERYRELFEASPTALIEEDWAVVRRCADQVRAEGAADVRAWFLSHPEEALRCFRGIRRQDVNKAALRLFKAASKKELLANFDRLGCDETRATAVSAVAGMAAGDEFFEAETFFRTLTGEKRNLLVSISADPVAEKSLPRYIVSLSDVTDLRRAQQEAIEQRQTAQLQRMESLAVTGRLAAGVAHEINNPLQGIVAQLSLLSDELPEPLRQGRRIELIHGGIDRIAGIVRNLLQLHRTPPEDEESCAASLVIPGLADMISSMSANQHIRLDVSVTPPELTIPMSANALTQVLLNLTLNAIDAMPRGGVIRLEARQTREAVLVYVSDTGEGIPPENRTRLFSPFFTTKGPKGTGLGLSVTHSLVTSAGGTIAVSDYRGGGTTFAIRFENQRAET